MSKQLKSEILKNEIAQKWADLKAIRDLVVSEEREFSQKERDQVESTLDQVREIEIQIEKERKEESLHKQIDHFDQIFSQQKERKSGEAAKGKPGGSLGAAFVDSPEWGAFVSQYGQGGRFPERARIDSPPVKASALLKKAIRRKDLITGASDSSAGAFVVPEDSGIYEPLGRWALSLRDLIDVRQTMSDTVEFVRQLTQITQAIPVQEANVTEYSGSSGEISGEKPEGAMTFERVAAVVKTLAVWIPATKRALSDAAQLRGLIDSELLADLEEELENQLLNGDGTGENFTGLANTAGTLVQAFNTDLAATARMAITHLLINGRQVPTAYLFNPQDWESFDLLQDTNGRYYWGGPGAQGQRTLWGVPVAQSFLQTQGTGWLANWRKMVLWDKEEGSISVSDSHEDFFIRNLVAILGEMRAAMGVIRPSAFVEIDLTSGS